MRLQLHLTSILFLTVLLEEHYILVYYGKYYQSVVLKLLPLQEIPYWKTVLLTLN